MKKVIEFKPKKQSEKQEKTTKKKINKKKLAIIITVVIVVLILAVTSIVYAYNKTFRDFMDKYILRKNITDENVPIIEIDYDSNTNVIPYGKYICILAENNLIQYNSSGRKEQEVKIEINNPVYDVNGRYLVIGEKDNQKLYLISGSNVIWEKNVDGNLTKVSVNKNGYVSTIVSGTTYKSVITTYDAKGNELFKSYLSSTIAVDSCISPDNKYLGYAEINTSGTIVKSNIKIISVEEASEKSTEPEFVYEAPQNSLILRIKYQDRNRLVCMYDDSIHMIESNVDVKLMDLAEDEKVTFGGKELNDGTASILFEKDISKDVDLLSVWLYCDIKESAEEGVATQGGFYVTFVDSKDLFQDTEIYVVDNLKDLIKNIKKNTSVDDFVSSLNIVNNGKVKIYDATGTKEVEGNVGTGMLARVMNEYEQSILDMDIVVKGDVSGDGNISVTDLVKVKRHLAKVQELDGVYEIAGNVTETGSVGITDLVKISRDVAKIEEVE